MRIYVILFLNIIGYHLAQAQIEVEPATETVMEMTVEEPEEPTSNHITFNQNGRQGIKDRVTGKVRLPAEYRSIHEQVADIFIVTDAQLNGVFNARLNKMIVPVQYHELHLSNVPGNYDFKNDSSFLVIAGNNGLVGLFDHNGQALLAAEYTKMDIEKTYVTLHKEKKEGIYFLNNNNTRIPVEYDNINTPYGVSGFIAAKSNEYFLFDKEGKLLLANNKRIELYGSWWEESRSTLLHIVNQKNKRGLYDGRENKFVLSLKYDWIGQRQKNCYIVTKKGKFGVVGPHDKIIIPFKHDTLVFLKPAASTRLKAGKDHQYALVDMHNKLLTPFVYEDIEGINDFYSVKTPKGYAVMDSLGKTITSAMYDHVGTFYNHRCAVFLNGNYGFIDEQGKLIEPIEHPSKARGFGTLHDLFTGFVIALKSESDSVLMEFAKNAVVDDYTREFMNRIRYEYRGFPQRGSKPGYSVEDAVAAYYKQIKHFRDRLKSRGALESLAFNGMEDNWIGYWDRAYNITGTEDWGVLTSQGRTFKYKLGELLYLDGYWKSFTSPRD